MEAPDKEVSSSSKRSFEEMSASQSSAIVIPSDIENLSSKRAHHEIEESDSKTVNLSPISLLSSKILLNIFQNLDYENLKNAGQVS
ncbi:MAG: hypothetical protein K0M45_05085 [Candidatus Paracaedibacteraceae bacterium]|nr:hypothetical protein [Candidatus Paracaedibacteraceae bacterium]